MTSLALAAAESLDSLTISELEQKVQQIDTELSTLAETSLNSGVGPIGYRSRTYPEAKNTVWIKIDLGEEKSIDEIILVPALWRDTQSGFVSDAFPIDFKILAGSEDNLEGTLVAEFSEKDALLPRIAPLVVPASGVRASWIKVEANRLSARAFDGLFLLQFAEILVFQGQENIALHRPVTVLNARPDVRPWTPNNLVDSILPYIMNAAEGSQSLAFVTTADEKPTITFDLGKEVSLSGLRLHAADQSDTVPQAFPGDFGLPRRFLLETSRNEDFSDATQSLETEITSIYQVGPIMDWRFPETTCRYVRLIVIEPYLLEEINFTATEIAFAEIELLSKGQNMALGKTVSSNFNSPRPARSLASIIDGHNLYGKILPTRQWLGELARRHELERERPLVAAQLAEQFSRQKANFRWMFWFTVLLVTGIGFLIFYYRLRSRRQEALIRERISANLHDSLGANLHAIGLLGDLAKEAIDSPEELTDSVDRIRSLTERTGRAARDCANMIEVTDVCQNLVVEMKRDALSFLADLKHQSSFQGEEFLEKFSKRKRIDLSLFYKEALANIIRHSGASSVKTQLTATAKELHLTVTDDGHGLMGKVPLSLQRRARLLGAQFNITEPEGGGTHLDLRFNTSKFPFLK